MLSRRARASALDIKNMPRKAAATPWVASANRRAVVSASNGRAAATVLNRTASVVTRTVPGDAPHWSCDIQGGGFR